MLYIFNGLLDRDNMPNDKARNYVTKILTYDINEYFGLVSTTENGEFYRLNIKNAGYFRQFY